ncbi:hypothetical protein PENTCL1PPCAC_14409 [Pristionchus entomophagus]|uniref:G protein-coupled receptor n=1 Tax=Pristionchus entomophagus TaxID=358040 RepID=A0AAV5TE74_9BILA|nr:hypothetical protein PENTCL1PPCAC_14409 [Pristionchus entomophagus]
MPEAVDIVHGVVAYSCALFASITVGINLIVIQILKNKRFKQNFFYTIYKIGCSIDIVAMVGNHTGALLPSRGWFLPFFLSSTLPGRVWLTTRTRILAVEVQISFG